MKKFLLILLSSILVFAVVGCTGNEDTFEEGQEETEEPLESEEPKELEDNLIEEGEPEDEVEEEPEEEVEVDIDKYYEMGKTLYELGLFSGVSTIEYSPNLEGSMNRQEAMKMIVSALGWEPAKTEDSPFVDVSDWAKSYVGRAYMKGIALGTVPEQNIFGAEDPVTKIQLLTFYLRALGYESTYAYDNAERLGELTGISDNLSGESENLKRYDLVAVTYDTLKATKQNEARTIIEELAIDGVVEEQLAKEKGLIKEYKYEKQRKTGPYTGNSENFDEFLEEDKLLVMFYEDDAEMLDVFNNVAVVLADELKVVWVDMESNLDIAEEQNITSYPTIKLYKGDETATLPPIPDEDTIVRWVRNN